MGYSKEKKGKKKKQNQASITANLKMGWRQKRPILFFVGGFCLLMILFYVFWQSAFFNSKIHPSIVSVNAKLSSFLLNILGQQTQAINEIISSSSYSISIGRGCDAIEAIALFLATTLAFPMALKTKVKGLFFGFFVLFFLNLVRIITLYLAGIYSPGIFEMMHVQIWPVIIIIFATALWIFVVRSDIKNRANVKN